ncbi:MAG: type II toxin-antitoxin system ParD family antitoxin [Alphaproteobacteria bacterium]|nr:type II toxin-antitoxin system ParD family antitoxin [Alphaproteobacteria bacterium]
MHVSLTDRLEAWIREKVESGLYNNASEVVREALRAKMQAEMSEAEKLDALRAEIQKGLDQLDRGETGTLTLEQLKSELRAAHRREDDAA